MNSMSHDKPLPPSAPAQMKPSGNKHESQPLWWIRTCWTWYLYAAHLISAVSQLFLQLRPDYSAIMHVFFNPHSALSLQYLMFCVTF